MARSWGRDNEVARFYETNAHDSKHILDLFEVIKTELIDEFKKRDRPKNLSNEIQ